MTAKIIIGASADETRMGLVENGKLMEYLVERTAEQHLVGSIFKGRVCNVVRGIQAAFVDLGLEQNAFLYLGEAMDVTEGQSIIVQISKDARGTKGPTATRELTLPGRYAVLLPQADYVGISRKITDKSEKERLNKIYNQVRPKGMGVVVRTAASGVSEELLAQDVAELAAAWRVLEARQRVAKAPCLLRRELDLPIRIVRDYLRPGLEEIVIDDLVTYKRVEELLLQLPQAKNIRLTLYQGLEDIFTYNQQQEAVAGISDKRVPLPSGGYLVIDYTEAMTVIDVNSGKFSGRENLEETIMQINREAASEIARQLRLRDIGGIIVVDFIDMNLAEDRQMLYERMCKNMQKDRARHNILPLSKFGLMQITRQRVRPAMDVNVEETCPTCFGKGKIKSSILFTDQLESKIDRLVNKIGISKFKLHVHPYVAAYINSGFVSIKRQWQMKYGFGVRIVASEKLAFLQYEFYDREGNFIDMKEEIETK